MNIRSSPAHVVAHHLRQEQVAKGVEDAGRVQTPFDLDSEALPVELVEDVRCPEGLPAFRAAMNEAMGPDVVGMLGSEPNTLFIAGREPALLQLL